MDYLYSAYCDCLISLGHTPTLADKLAYDILAFVASGKRGGRHTFSGVVPFILRGLARMHGYGVRAEHRAFQPALHLSNSKGWLQRFIVSRSDFGTPVQRISLCPAIYIYLCKITEFSKAVPFDGGCIAAYQFYKKVAVGRNDDESSTRK